MKFLKLNSIAKLTLVVTIVLWVLALAIGLIALSGDRLLPYIYGLSFGILVDVLKIILLNYLVNKTFDQAPDKRKGKFSAASNYLLRFMLTAVVLIVGALVPQFSLLGVIIAVLISQAAVYVAYFSVKNKESKTKRDINRQVDSHEEEEPDDTGQEESEAEFLDAIEDKDMRNDLRKFF